MTDPDLVRLDDVRAAAERIGGRVRHTPVLPVDLGLPGLHVKAECLQVGGSFKLRGAMNAVARLTPEQLSRGVVTHSSGNHAQALARAARAHGTHATVVMPHTAPEVKRRLTAQHGATVVLVDISERASRAAEIEAETGAVFIPPFDHPDTIAGQGTVGLELATDLPDVRTVYVPVSGGGLISGVAVAVKALAPQARVVAVEPALAGDLAEGWRTGTRADWSTDLTSRTIADGLQAHAVGELPWRHITALVDDVVTVSEDEIVDAVRLLAFEARLVCEPSGAVSVAGALKVGYDDDGPSVAVVSGGNVDAAWLATALAR